MIRVIDPIDLIDLIDLPSPVNDIKTLVMLLTVILFKLDSSIFLNNLTITHPRPMKPFAMGFYSPV